MRSFGLRCHITVMASFSRFVLPADYNASIFRVACSKMCSSWSETPQTHDNSNCSIHASVAFWLKPPRSARLQVAIRLRFSPPISFRPASHAIRGTDMPALPVRCRQVPIELKGRCPHPVAVAASIVTETARLDSFAALDAQGSILELARHGCSPSTPTLPATRITSPSARRSNAPAHLPRVHDVLPFRKKNFYIRRGIIPPRWCLRR
ncbi:hypothetical protein ABH945_004928 [Paraburkholderia sp. GAS333]